ncbi:unnamed protein product, partial [Hapterophycus canaliculatus]
GTSAFGPVAGRGLLRPGDILVEVNGSPVAGPAARDAGIQSFEDAVRAVAAVAIERTATTGASEHPGGRPHLRPRVLKFRRETQRQRPTFASIPSAPPLTLPKDRLKGGRISDTSGFSSARSQVTPVLIAEPGTRDTSSLASSKRDDGRFASSAVHLSPRQDASSVDVDRVSVTMSSRSRGSVTSAGSHASFMSRESGKVGDILRTKKRGGGQRRTRDGSSVFSVTSAATRIKADARRGDALLEPIVCPRQQLLKKTLEMNPILRPLAVCLTNLSYWYQQRRLLGGSRHMHRRVVFDPRSKRWEASIYKLGDRPSDGKLVPILTPIKSVATKLSTEGQASYHSWEDSTRRLCALALAAKSAKERDANPGAVRGPKPPGLNQHTMLQTHMSVLVVSDTFVGLSHADRLALVFTALHDGLAAHVHPVPSPLSPSSSTTTTISPLPSPRTPTPSFPRPTETSSTAMKMPEQEETDTNAEGGRAGATSEGSGNRKCLSLQHTGEDTRGQGGRAGIVPSDGTEEEKGRQAAVKEKGYGEEEGQGQGEGGNSETRKKRKNQEGNEAEKEGSGCDGIGKHRMISDQQRTRRRHMKGQHGVIRGGVKASFVGPNVQALPVWGALDAIAGSSLLVDCRTPAQWRPEEYRPTGQELWGAARSGHRTMANDPRVQVASVRRSMERVIAESKVLREAAPKFEHFDRFNEEKGSAGGGEATPTGSGPRDAPGKDSARSHTKEISGDRGGSPTRPPKQTAFAVAHKATVGRTHPHFFHGLGPNARKLFMDLYAENRSRLLAPISRGATGRFVASSSPSGQASSAAPFNGSCLPTVVTAGSDARPQLPLPGESQRPRPVTSSSARGGGGAADTVRHAAGAFAASGPPPDLDAAILDRYGVLLCRISEAATRIQRARRLGGVPRAARRLRRRQRATLAVQRVFRGHLSRRYASIWKVVTSLASTRMSAGWRRFTARRKFLVFRARARAGAIGFQALFRGHVARRYAAWCAAHFFAARHIQRGARAFTARCYARRKRAARAFQLCGIAAILLIQRTTRGFLVRKAYERRFEEAVRVRVIVPAAGVLQKCWRGKKGREQGALRRRMWAAATEIQAREMGWPGRLFRHVRGLSKRMWWTRVLICRLEHAMATKIAALGRGYIDRELMKARAERRHFLHTIMPASILIQSQWRGYTKRRDLAK